MNLNGFNLKLPRINVDGFSNSMNFGLLAQNPHESTSLMNPIVRNILAVIVGGIVGMSVNMALIMVSGSIIQNPEGFDPTSEESIAATAHLLESRHFLMPFIAHAGGTLAGALIAALIAATHKMKFAMGIGVFFLIGGIAACFMIPAPTWFIIVDLVIAYIPMGILGGRLAGAKN